MKQPLMKKTSSIRKMKNREWQKHIKQFLSTLNSESEYKGKVLQNFDGWDTDKVMRWLKAKEKEYTQATMGGKDNEFIKAEIVHCKQVLAGRRAKYEF
jgi:hypothetical protein